MCHLLLPLLLLAADTGTVTRAPELAIPAGYYAPAAPERDDWFGEDKFKHLAMSYMITAGSFGVARELADRDASIASAVALGVIAGIAKEVYDRRDSRRISVKDLLWDAAGIAAGAMIAKQTR